MDVDFEEENLRSLQIEEDEGPIRPSSRIRRRIRIESEVSRPNTAQLADTPRIRHDSGGDQSPRCGVGEPDRFLPIANISRIMKKRLPANGKIAKDAKETVQECVSEFISFITSEYVHGF
ncbi:hypothetical protein SASPL_105664 [Salvia splendens]|uniref:Transcription factor CBF/NF-Y/archaeal histone domain-containing protein n=1 Tax=Salvia splendens TaxID=180675 RepID=A0A8X8YQV9_SALSN|nr:hypothetical protein SASPL_105664 [Salvia splendens]